MIMGQSCRNLSFRSGLDIKFFGNSRSVYYASHWLKLLGEPQSTGKQKSSIIILDDNWETDVADELAKAEVVIKLWDYQVGYSGRGIHASAISGASSVIGYPNSAGIPLSSEIPEKWCGAYGIILALAELWRRRDGKNRKKVCYDISAADVMRSFSLQNAGDKKEMSRRWRRNGRVCVEHGGIFPMGFYACKDGHVALLGRSRKDWKNIKAAIGNPEWAEDPAFTDPFLLAKNSTKADQFLEETLSNFSRDFLLTEGLKNNAVIAPVYTQKEANERNIFRPTFITNNQPSMPFLVHKTPRIQIRTPSRRETSNIDAADAPLSGLRCIELCWIWSGPMVGQILADLGAEVIKVESSKRFDLYRTRGLEHLRGKMHEQTRLESSIYFHSLNRNKLGLSLDLKNSAGLSAMRELIGCSDLLLDNFTVGTIDRLGLGPHVLAEINPSIVQLSMSGPGRGSSVENLRSYGLVLSALGGTEITIRDDIGNFIGSPTFSISDPNAAVFGTIAALAGALCAQTKGLGCSIDLSQIEAAATLTGTPTIIPDRHEIILRTSDSVFVAVSIPICEYDRNKITRKVLEKLTREELFEKCIELGGEAADLIELDDSDKSSLFSKCPSWIAACHPYTGDEMLVAAPWRINGRRPTLRKPAPLIGESNDYILRTILKLDEEEIASIKSSDLETPV